MTEEPIPDKPQIEVVSDEDWKERVKAEDAQLDAQTQQEEPSDTQAAPEIDPNTIPPASFGTLVQMFSTQAIVSLGLIPDPEGKVVRQLPLAKHFIDVLGVIEEKTRGNLSPEEAQSLDGTLHELRMAYMEVAQHPASGPGGS